MSFFYSRVCVSLAALVVSSLPYVAHASISIECGGGRAAVTTMMSGGDWVGFSVRTEDGDIIDRPPKEHAGGMVGTKGYSFTYPTNRNVVEARASTWDDYDRRKNRMIGRVDDSGWVNCY
jgi:hypothetical protein